MSARDRHDLDVHCSTEPTGKRVEAGEDPPVELGDLGEIVRREPHLAADARVVGEDDDRVAGDAPKLADAALPFVVPVVDGQDRHRRIHARVPQRQVAGGRTDRRSELLRPLRGHHVARLDRDHMPIAGLVRPRAGSDVDDGPRVPERAMDGRRDARILLPRQRVADADPVIARLDHVLAPASAQRGGQSVEPSQPYQRSGSISALIRVRRRLLNCLRV